MDVESFNDGILAAIVVAEGGVAGVGSPIAYIAESESDLEAAKAKAAGGCMGEVAVIMRHRQEHWWWVRVDHWPTGRPARWRAEGGWRNGSEAASWPSGLEHQSWFEAARKASSAPTQSGLMGGMSNWALGRTGQPAGT